MARALKARASPLFRLNLCSQWCEGRSVILQAKALFSDPRSPTSLRKRELAITITYSK
jgi:hypothetical protein